MRFRPQLFWQEVLPEHIADASLQFEADFASGKNYARIASGDKTYAADGALARSTAVALEDVGADAPDAEAVGRALRAAVTWGDPAKLRHLLSSCYCGVPHLGGALHEAAARGEQECIEVLLSAKAKPTVVGAPLYVSDTDDERAAQCTLCWPRRSSCLPDFS